MWVFALPVEVGIRGHRERQKDRLITHMLDGTCLLRTTSLDRNSLPERSPLQRQGMPSRVHANFSRDFV